ncbi:CPBP family glutamic-type intramembrane protease [Imhoffiella purpurea]|uniref:CAAX amino terminal protease family protein n=1 Tax=Imhoffiella purpurea TaxID=1249627 RepID=W9V5N1_9GAMM|nr:CPBP family glutamic-type intramembrane protease [Imhoffiella purpurea]EXJ14823.1 CAAX amino terminal protease family protein [Imhoffiella purpurea]
MSDDIQISDLLARETVSSMRDAVMSMDRTGTIIMLNPAAERLLRVSAGDVLGRSFAQTFIDRVDLEDLNDCILQAIYDPATPHTAEIQILGGNGDRYHLVVRTSLLVGEGGEPVGVVAVVADVSEQVRLLEEKLEQVRVRQLFGRFFLYTLGVMSIGTIVNNLIARSIVDFDIYTPAFAWGYLVVLLVPSFFAIRAMGLSWRDLGLSADGLSRSLKEGILISVAFAGLVAILALTLYHFGALPGHPGQFEPLPTFGYLIHSFFQELVARGFLQTAFQRFLDDRKGVRSVLLTSSLFGLFHLHFGFSAVALTLVSGVVFGLFYLRNPNIFGVTLLHFFVGGCAFWFGLL